MYPPYVTSTHVIRIFPLLLCPTENLRPPSDNDADDEDDHEDDDEDDDDGNNQDDEEKDEDSIDGACASDPFSNRISQAGGWIRGGWIRAAHLVTAAAAPGKGLEV